MNCGGTLVKEDGYYAFQVSAGSAFYAIVYWWVNGPDGWVADCPMPDGVFRTRIGHARTGDATANRRAAQTANARCLGADLGTGLGDAWVRMPVRRIGIRGTVPY